MTELKPTRNEYSNYGLGTALAAVAVWLVGPGAFDVFVVPPEVGVFAGSIFVWAAWKLGLGND